MEIKVYTDGSKIKTKIFGGLTVRQVIGFGTVILMMILMLVSELLLHVDSNIISPLLMLVVFPVLFTCFFKIKGLPADRWFRLRLRFYLLKKKRTYQTERIKVYSHAQFTQGKKVKETDSHSQ